MRRASSKQCICLFSHTVGDDGSVSKDEEEILHLPDSPMATSPGEEEDKHVDPTDTETLHAPAQEVESLMSAGTKNDPKRFCMYFNKESKSEIEERKREAATIAITSVPVVYTQYHSHYFNACGIYTIP